MDSEETVKRRTKHLFYLEGNISSGKTTAVEALRAAGYSVFEEPIDVWQREYVSGNKNILELFYEDRKTWGFKFEMVSLMTRYKQLRAAHIALKTHDIVFVERSLMTDRHVFALNLYRNGFFEPLDWKIYCEWHDMFIEIVGGFKDIMTIYMSIPALQGKIQVPVADVVTHYIYIQTPPDACFDRKLGRARKCEDDVAPKYFQELHEHHEEWLVDTASPRAVHVVNGAGSPEEIVRDIIAIVH
jgi:deoxyadenosine/deoxycytidine kinase